MVVNELEMSRSFEEIVGGLEVGEEREREGRESVTGHSTLKAAPSARVQVTRATNVAFNRQSSSMDYEYMGVSQSFEETRWRTTK